MPRVSKKSDAQMVALYGAVMREPLERGIVRSGNNPVADMAETEIADYYEVEPEPLNHKSQRASCSANVERQAQSILPAVVNNSPTWLRSECGELKRLAFPDGQR